MPRIERRIFKHGRFPQWLLSLRVPILTHDSARCQDMAGERRRSIRVPGSTLLTRTREGVRSTMGLGRCRRGAVARSPQRGAPPTQVARSSSPASHLFQLSSAPNTEAGVAHPYFLPISVAELVR
jgi:hypothetical protein